IVLKASAKNPAERYATAQELADDLQRLLKDEPIRAKRPTLTQRVRKWSRRHRPVVVSAGIAAALVVLVAVVGLVLSNVAIAREKKQAEDAYQAEKQAKEALEQALEREQETLYFQRIGLAERELAAKNVGRAEELLEECPLRLRGWEWHFLKRLR